MSSEEINDIALVSKASLRGEVGIGSQPVVTTPGDLEFSDLDDNDGKFLDFEVMIEWYPVLLGTSLWGIVSSASTARVILGLKTSRPTYRSKDGSSVADFDSNLRSTGVL
jgi:hypothetical protein